MNASPLETPTLFVDLDGPILNTADRNYDLYQSIVKDLGGATTYDRCDFWELKRSGLSSAEIVRRDSGANCIDAARFSELWLAQIEAPDWLSYDRLHTGVVDWLDRIASSFYLVLVTLRQSRSNLDQQLERLGLTGLFETVLCDSPVIGKGWETKRRLIANCGLQIKGVMIGDSEIDIRAGKLLGLGTIAVSSGIRNREFLAAERPDLLVESLTELNADSMFSMIK